MQKAIRRGDAKLAGYWALELWASGFGQYVWRRLLTVSAEDCWGILTAETKALHDSYTEINQHVNFVTSRREMEEIGEEDLVILHYHCLHHGHSSSIVIRREARDQAKAAIKTSR